MTGRSGCPAFVIMIAFNPMGQQIHSSVNEFQDYGHQIVSWNTINGLDKNIGAGVYFYQLLVENNIKIGKRILLR